MNPKSLRTTLPASAAKPLSEAAAAVARPFPPAQGKSRGRPRQAKPFQVDGRAGWWANTTLPDRSRPLRSFESEEEAAAWIRDLYIAAAQGQLPALGGPHEARVAQALYKYAYQFTVVKGGAEAELTRINNYLVGGGLPTLRLVVDAHGCHCIGGAIRGRRRDRIIGAA